MRLQLGIRTVAALALTLLWAAPAMAHHKPHEFKSHEDAARHNLAKHDGHGHGYGHAQGRYGRYDERDNRHYRPVTFTHYMNGHPVRVVMHSPYYCARCNHHFQRQDAFHRHLHRSHGLSRFWRHLTRVGWGWVYFG